jgi:hypothetical protein
MDLFGEELGSFGQLSADDRFLLAELLRLRVVYMQKAVGLAELQIAVLADPTPENPFQISPNN